MNIALIKAGGVGRRMGAEIPKQFISIDGKPIIIYTLESFERHPNIDEIVVVCLKGWHDILRSYCKQFGIKKVKMIVNGGETSLKSIKNGLMAMRDHYSDDDMVLVHDGNRPLISQEIISDTIASCQRYGSAVAAIPVTDEVMEIEGDALSSTKFLDRKKMYRIQTPDAYRFSLLRSLFDKATEEQLTNLGATNTLMIACGGTVHFSHGSELNIRLTTQEDILLCKSLLVMREKQ